MKSFLSNAVFRNWRPYSAVLPYNLNWMVAEGDPMIQGNRFGVISFVDIGCRGGLPDELWPIRKIIYQVGFDADNRECVRLNSDKHELYKREIFPLFVGGASGVSEFHLFKSPGESSLLRPDERFSRLFANEHFVIDRSVEVQAITLDSFFQQRPTLVTPDFIKIDAQGTELDILKGAKECLKNTMLVEVEVEFLPLYEGQALFPEVMRYMLDSGFELLFINRVFQQRKGFAGIAKGQMTFGDALFARREDCCTGFDERKMARYLILLINYGYLDLAHHILKTFKFEAETNSFFQSYLAKRAGNRYINYAKKVINPLIDKIILLLLHVRKHNSMKIDSDRSWPIR